MKKPLMTVGCEEIVTSLEQELQMRINWLEEGLNKLINHYSYTTVPREVRHIAQSYLDGEPTTADEFNEAQIQEGEELMKEFSRMIEE